MNKNFILFLVLTVAFSFAYGISADVINIENPLSVNTFDELFSSISTYLLGIVGVIATTVIVIAGAMMVFSGGDPKWVNMGKSALISAVIGLGIVLAASGLIQVVTAVIGA